MPIIVCPTFASGSFSIISGTSTFDLLSDSALASGANGYQNTVPDITVGSSNCGLTNKVNTQSIAPTFSTSLGFFGTTGQQS